MEFKEQIKQPGEKMLNRLNQAKPDEITKSAFILMINLKFIYCF